MPGGPEESIFKDEFNASLEGLQLVCAAGPLNCSADILLARLFISSKWFRCKDCRFLNSARELFRQLAMNGNSQLFQ